MSFKIEFYPDKSYYEEAYNEIISTLKLKKYEPIFALVIIFFGITLFFINQNKNLSFISIIFIGIGIYEFMKYYYEKQKWINDRLKSKILGEKLKLEFEEDFIIHSGPFSNGKIDWNGIKDILKTKNGILIKLETGISIYLPYKFFNNKGEIDFILFKKNRGIEQ